jgi:hypothetical protein
MENENEILAKIITKNEEFLICEKNTLIGREQGISLNEDVYGIQKLIFLI